MANHNPQASVSLVPRGFGGLRLCRYYGLNAGVPNEIGTGSLSGRLAGSRRVVDRSLQLWIADQLRHQPKLTRPTACPADDNSQVFLLFAYAEAAIDPVVVRLSGCALATNNSLDGSFFAPASLLGAIRHLTRGA